MMMSKEKEETRDGSDGEMDVDIVVDCRSYHHKVVRDLVWVFASPTIFPEKRNATTSPRRFVLQSREWLRKLDEDPRPLMEYVHKHLRGWALGSYYTILINFWLKRMSSVHILEKPVVNAKLLPKRQTLGQLKWVFKSPKEPQVAIHWESSVKFFVDSNIHMSENSRKLIKLCRKSDETSAQDAIEVLKTKLDEVNINARCSNSGKTALMIAAWRGHIDVVKALLDHGADINVYATGLGSLGKTAIFFACTRCRNDVVRLLLRRGARVTIVNNKGQTVRSLAATHLDKETRLEIEKIEHEQIEKIGWLDFSSQRDGNIYGDLDPRFEIGQVALSSSSSSSSSTTTTTTTTKTTDVVNGTTYESRKQRYESYNNKKKQQEASTRLRRFVGPYLSENLHERALTASRKLSIVSSAVKKWIQRETDTKHVRSEYILRGYLFYPLVSYQNIKCCTKGLNPKHLRGWIVNRPEELLIHSKILKTTARTRWAILKKLYWMSTARAVTKTDLTDVIEVEMEKYKTPIRRLDCMCTYDVNNTKHTRQDCRSLQNLNERELLSGPALIRMLNKIKSKKSILVCQLEIVRQEQEGHFVWEESSRGFVLYPENWHTSAHVISGREMGKSNLATSSKVACVYEESNKDVICVDDTESLNNIESFNIELLFSSLKSSTGDEIIKNMTNCNLLIEFVCSYALDNTRICHKLLSLLMKSPTKKNNISTESRKKLSRFIANHVFSSSSSSSSSSPPYRVFYRVLIYLKLQLDFSDIPNDTLQNHFLRSISSNHYRDLRDLADLLLLIKRYDFMTYSLVERINVDECTREHLDIVKRLCGMNQSLRDRIEDMFGRTFQTSSYHKEQKIMLEFCDEKTTKIMHVESQQELRGVVLVDSEKVFKSSVSIMSSQSVLALDCEWEPKRKTLQLIQIATNDAVYVLDVQRLVQIGQSKRLTSFLSNIFEKSLILGWCMNHDLKQICTTFPHALELRKVLRCVDLQRHVASSHKITLSLNDACTSILGVGLNKSCQLSNWESRPLTKSQIEYAALDAWVLTLLTKKIKPYQKSFVWNCPFPVPLGLDDVRKDLNRRFRSSSCSIPLIRKLKELKPNEILVKTIAFFLILKKIRKRIPICVVLNVDSVVDVQKLKSCCVDIPKEEGILVSDVCLASLNELITVFGYVPGSLGPFGTRESVKIVMDKSLLFDEKKKYLCCGAGLRDCVFNILALDLARCPDVVCDHVSK